MLLSYVNLGVDIQCSTGGVAKDEVSQAPLLGAPSEDAQNEQELDSSGCGLSLAVHGRRIPEHDRLCWNLMDPTSYKLCAIYHILFRIPIWYMDHKLHCKCHLAASRV